MAITSLGTPAPQRAVDWALAPNETILWQGRPNAAPYLGKNHLFTLIRGAFALILFVYIIGRLNMGVSQYFDIQAIVFVIFFMSVPIDVIKSAFRRRRSHYALTTQRALIKTDLPFFGQRLRSYPISATQPVDMLRGRRFSTFHFAAPKRAFWDFRNRSASLGFERIAEGDTVLALLMQVQNRIGQTAAVHV